VVDVTQVERVIEAARSFQGVCQVDFLLPDVIDGGAPITRLGARIQDAEERGYVFETIGWRDKTKVYRLLSEPEAAPSGGRTGASQVTLPQVPAPPSPKPVACTPHWMADL
jgi:hypothetical protein